MKWTTGKYKICYFNVIEGQVSLPTRYTESLYQQFIFQYFVGHHKSALEELSQNLQQIFPFPGNQIFRFFSLTVPSCRLVENILYTFYLGQRWYDLCILKQIYLKISFCE